MAEVTLTPGAVFTIVGVGSDLPPVGPPPQWADNDDATYAVVSSDGSSTGQVQPRAHFDPYEFADLPVSVVYHVRASNTSADFEPFTVGLVSDDFSVFMASDALSFHNVQATAVPTWFASDPIEIPDPTAFATCSAGGTVMLITAQITHEGTSFDNRTTIHEAYLVVTYGSVVPPVTEHATRLFPRDDALGLGSAPRLHPPPRSGRVVGGHM